MPDDAVLALKPDGHTAVIALTHDPKLDDLALMEALQSPAFYVGAIGSRVNQAKRKQRLAEHFGLTEAELARCTARWASRTARARRRRSRCQHPGRADRRALRLAHSRAGVRNLRLGWNGPDATSVTVLVNDLDQPAQDPLGLSREQFDADPVPDHPSRHCSSTPARPPARASSAPAGAPLR
jgi:hypothetical protein